MYSPTGFKVSGMKERKDLPFISRAQLLKESKLLLKESKFVNIQVDSGTYHFKMEYFK